MQQRNYAHIRQIMIDAMLADDTSVSNDDLMSIFDVVSDPEELMEACEDPTDDQSMRIIKSAIETYVDQLSEDAVTRQHKLIEAAQARAGQFGDRSFPPSFVDFIARFGFSDFRGPVGHIHLWLLALNWELSRSKEDLGQPLTRWLWSL